MQSLAYSGYVQSRTMGNLVAFPGVVLDDVEEKQTPRGRRLAETSTTIMASQPFENYDQVKAVIDYFLNKRDYRGAAMFVTGLCTGLRISDICALKVGDVLDSVMPLQFKRVIDIREKKTGKRTCSLDDEMLITEAMQKYISLYVMNSRGQCVLKAEDYLFASNKGHGTTPMNTDYANRMLRPAFKAAAPHLRLSSHTMRKTFATIANTLASTSKDIQNGCLAMADTSIMLRHASQATTMNYVGVRLPRTTSLRRGVSDFVLGRTAVKSMELSYQYELEDD
jgi:integrase